MDGQHYRHSYYMEQPTLLVLQDNAILDVSPATRSTLVLIRLTGYASLVFSERW